MAEGGTDDEVISGGDAPAASEPSSEQSSGRYPLDDVEEETEAETEAAQKRTQAARAEGEEAEALQRIRDNQEKRWWQYDREKERAQRERLKSFAKRQFQGAKNAGRWGVDRARRGANFTVRTVQKTARTAEEVANARTAYFIAVLFFYALDIAYSFNYAMRIVIYIPLSFWAATAYGREGDIRSNMKTYGFMYLFVVLPPFMKYFTTVKMIELSRIFDYWAVFGNLFLWQIMINPPRESGIYKIIQVSYWIFIALLSFGMLFGTGITLDQYSQNIDVNYVVQNIKEYMIHGWHSSKTTIIAGTRNMKNVVPSILDASTNGAYSANTVAPNKDNWVLKPSPELRAFQPPGNVGEGESFSYYSAFSGKRKIKNDDGITIKDFERMAATKIVKFGCRAYKEEKYDSGKIRTVLAEGKIGEKSSDELKYLMLMVGSSENPVVTNVKCTFEEGVDRSAHIETYANFNFHVETVLKVNYLELDERLEKYGVVGAAFLWKKNPEEDEYNLMKVKKPAVQNGDGPVLLSIEFPEEYPLGIDPKKSVSANLFITIRNTNPGGMISGISSFKVKLPDDLILSTCDYGKRRVHLAVKPITDHDGTNTYSIPSVYDNLFPIETSISFMCGVSAKAGVQIKKTIDAEVIVLVDYSYDVVDRPGISIGNGYLTALHQEDFSLKDLPEGVKAIFSPLDWGDMKDYFGGTACQLPVKDGRFSNDWGAQREGGRRKHEGIDISAPEGAEVRAYASGIVVRLGCNNLGGNRVGIRSNDNPDYYFYYAHLKDYAPGLKVGSKIKAGQVIGHVGTTIGCRQRCSREMCGVPGKTSPHLHFGVYKKAGRKQIAVNPYPYLNGMKKPEGINCGYTV